MTGGEGAMLVEVLGQFGAAGLIGLLWIVERRMATKRDRQLDEAHRGVLEQDRAVGALLEVLRRNTRAIARLEQSQRRLIDLLEAMRRGDGASAA
jgi:hypothetical protein